MRFNQRLGDFEPKPVMDLAIPVDTAVAPWVSSVIVDSSHQAHSHRRLVQVDAAQASFNSHQVIGYNERVI